VNMSNEEVKAKSDQNSSSSASDEKNNKISRSWTLPDDGGLEIAALEKIKTEMMNKLDIRDRSSFLRTHPRCFVGKDAVQFLIDTKYAKDAEEAIQIGNQLIEAGVIEHVTREHMFKNEDLLYRFVEHDPTKSARYETHDSLKIAKTNTIVFVHGMFMTPLCWENWVKFFEGKKYTVLNPSWPLHDTTVTEQVKKNPDMEKGKVTLADVVGHYRTVVKGLKEKPILIGHSMGGLVVQILLNEGLAAGAIAIDTAPPRFVISLKWNFIKSNWGVLSPFVNDRETFYPSLAEFSFAFVNGMEESERKAVYEKHVVPESRLVGKGPTTTTASIKGDRKREPLLLIAGGQDNIVPASLNRSNFKVYAKSKSITEFKEFSDRNHWLIGSKGWEDLATFVLEWIHKNS